MSRIIFLKQLPLNSDEEYLIKIGEKEPKVIMVHDDPEDEKNQFKHIIQSNGEEIDTLQIFEDYCKGTWVEYDPIMDQNYKSYFKCSTWTFNTNEIHFEIDEDYKEPYHSSSEILQDKTAVKLILSNKESSNHEKADNLLTLLLDRQMYLNDPDEFTADQADLIYNTAEYADFFDKVINIIKQLDPIIWNANKSQITLPTLQDFL